MNLHFIWKAVVIVVGGVLILRVAGRKSISQLTVAQTVMMVAVGSLIIQPVGDRNIWITLLITLLMVITLIGIEYIVLKSDVMESFLYGKSRMVIENGTIIESNIKKLRLSVDMLEVRLRQQGIQRISDLQWATIESNGQLGYLLKPGKQYATKEDIDRLVMMLQASMPHLSMPLSATESSGPGHLFTEVHTKQHIDEPPERLK
ncbi:DUF421 domain-containing protein [Paenibacillus wynnii]|uniref:Membrane protein n=1 Tax=Paenibacillus wynnii TaxID=268407 RepID=A0A098MBF9_9BACL|nr:DUF421 domain-containing protein [Paenibacillus wynnii]KGE19388.1 membrane protein [Paenibacillus wynnii]